MPLIETKLTLNATPRDGLIEDKSSGHNHTSLQIHTTKQKCMFVHLDNKLRQLVTRYMLCDKGCRITFKCLC